LIIGSKDSDLSLVSNKNFSEILWPSGWALSQVTWAKTAQKPLHNCILEDWLIRLSPWTAL